MATGYLHDTYHSKYLLRVTLVLGAFSLIPLFSPSEVQAASYNWFATYNGGVLSGTSGEGIYNRVPDVSAPYALPSSFKKVLIQGPDAGTEPNPAVGALISSGSQSVEVGSLATEDAYFKNTDLVLSSLNFDTLYNSIDAELPGSCSSLFDNGKLDPNVWYKLSVSCMEQALNGAATFPGYRLQDDGVVVFVVKKEASAEELNIDDEIISRSDKRRILIVTDADVVVLSDVGNTQASLVSYVGDYYEDTEPNIQAAFITTGNFIVESESASSDTALILEGPVAAKGKMALNRSVNDVVSGGYNYAFPGVYVKYNPMYVAELSIKNKALSGVSGSKVTWRYD